MALYATTTAATTTIAKTILPIMLMSFHIVFSFPIFPPSLLVLYRQFELTAQKP